MGKIALTLYSLRDHCTNENDFNKTLECVRNMGYGYVQVSGITLSNRMSHVLIEIFLSH